MRRWVGVAILVVVALGWRAASAQSRGAIEIGLDGGVGLAVFDRQTFITVGFPAQNLRFGWFAGDRVEIEPSVAFQRLTSQQDPAFSLSGEENDRETSGRIDLALAYHGGGTGERGRPYVKGGGLVVFGGGAPDHLESQFGVEAGLGWKQRFESHWAFRVELTVARTFNTSALGGGWLPALAFGFSHFSKSE